MELAFEINTNELIHSLVVNSDDDLVNFVVELNKFMADAGFTEEVITRLYSVLVKEYTADELKCLHNRLGEINFMSKYRKGNNE